MMHGRQRECVAPLAMQSALLYGLMMAGREHYGAVARKRSGRSKRQRIAVATRRRALIRDARLKRALILRLWKAFSAGPEKCVKFERAHTVPSSFLKLKFQHTPFPDPENQLSR
jgi:hypothetical protein